MEVVSGKWKVLILWELHTQDRRFGELRKGVPGVSDKVLVEQLRQLEADGVVRRELSDSMSSPRVDYSLTSMGLALFEALKPLGAWGREHLITPADSDTDADADRDQVLAAPLTRVPD
jgi:DNA-binding HxlR family transcriptional regulator